MNFPTRTPVELNSSAEEGGTNNRSRQIFFLFFPSINVFSKLLTFIPFTNWIMPSSVIERKLTCHLNMFL